MKSSTLLSMAIILIFSMSIHCQDLKIEQATSETASVKLIKGTAELSNASGGRFVPLTFDETLNIGPDDNLTTGVDSRVEIEYSDGTSLVIKSNAQLFLLKSGIRLIAGEARISIPGRQQEFHILTRTNSARSLKADLIVKAEPESAIFNLISGQLTLSDKIGNTLRLEEGQAIKVTTVGFGSTVGFDENELLDRFDERRDQKSGASFSINTLLIGGIILLILILSILLLVLRKRHNRPKAVKPSTFIEAPPPPEKKESQPVIQPEETKPVQPVKKNFCESCGDRLAEDAKFCTSCGSKVEG